MITKASAAKLVRRGVKEVVKALKKGEKGLCIIAGDISPIDVICHIPVYCEEKAVPYIYVPSKEDLGAASQTKRPTSIVMVKAGSDAAVKALFDECVSEVKKVTPKF
jgi:H/ACA ribonucleoprotein complex subunit 2